MKKVILLLVFTGSFLLIHAQTYTDAKECYPDCNFSFQDIENELRPTFSSSDIMDAHAIEIISQKMEQFRKEDADKYHLLKNKYCAALTGWIQNGECYHGGPPPCCNSLVAVPWKKVSVEKAKSALFAEWHQTQEKRNKDISQAVRNGYELTRKQVYNQFNAFYKQATECTKVLRDDAAYYNKNKAIVNQYISQMGNLYTQMKEYIDVKIPGAQQVQNVQFTTVEMDKLRVEICKVTEEISQGKIFDPLLTQHNNMYSDFPWQKEAVAKAKMAEAVNNKSSKVSINTDEQTKDNSTNQNELASIDNDQPVDFTKPIVRSKSVKVDAVIATDQKKATTQKATAIKNNDNKTSRGDEVSEEEKVTQIVKTVTNKNKIDSLQKVGIKINKSIEAEGDKDKSFYVKASAGIMYQRIPTLQNFIYFDKAAETKVRAFDAYGFTGNLRVAILNNQMFSIQVEPFASYSWHFDISQSKKLFINSRDTSYSRGTDKSVGGMLSIGFALGKQLGLEQDLRIFLKGGYTYRQGNDTSALFDANTPVNTHYSDTKYAYSTLKLGVGAYYSFGDIDQYAEVSAYKEYPSFFPSIKSNFFRYNIFSFEAKVAYKKAIIAVQYAKNYPVAGTVSYTDNFTKINSDLWIVSFTYPINIFSQNQKN